MGDELRAIFSSLDSDDSGKVSFEEFVMGCLQLRGQAKTVDLVTHMRENKKIMQRITWSAKNTEAQLKDLRHIVAVACEGLVNAAHSFDCSVARQETDEVPDLCMHPSRRVDLS